ncbi:MAG: hypothetical protein LBS53_14060 [Synergistaceae bacterium]|jgi:hypothetical protein|nr:hypothetical protein [Synergistaceae bacterium]
MKRIVKITLASIISFTLIVTALPIAAQISGSMQNAEDFNVGNAFNKFVENEIYASAASKVKHNKKLYLKIFVPYSNKYGRRQPLQMWEKGIESNRFVTEIQFG